MSLAIRVDRVSKLYRRTSVGHKLRTLKSALLERSLTSGLTEEESIVALRDVSLQVDRGEAFGLIGLNGSGKSTLLKLIAGILRPTSGAIEVRGRAAALIELGAGFHPEISGRENVYINGAVLGLSRRDIDRRFDEIVEFSGLRDHIEEPVKNYSSGMYVRLGFAIAIHTDPEILLVDEVLAVGDEAFAHRCLARIGEFLERGKTLLMVSHSLSLIEGVCDRAAWIDGGGVRLSGLPRRVTDAYRQSVAEAEGRGHLQAKADRVDGAAEPAPAEPSEGAAADDEDGAGALRWGSMEVRIEQVRLLVEGQERYHFTTGSAVCLEVDTVATVPVEDFVFGVAIATPRGVEVWGTNTDLDGYRPGRLEVGPGQVVLCCHELRLAPGEYTVDIAVHARDGRPYDYRRRLVGFTVTAATAGVGVYFPEHRWSFSRGVLWEAGSPSAETPSRVDEGAE